MVVQKTNNKWSPTSRKTTLEDGSTRVLYKNPMFPGEVRVRKMRKGRDGRMTASYVKPRAKKGQHGGTDSVFGQRNECGKKAYVACIVPFNGCTWSTSEEYCIPSVDSK